MTPSLRRQSGRSSVRARIDAAPYSPPSKTKPVDISRGVPKKSRARGITHNAIAKISDDSEYVLVENASPSSTNTVLAAFEDIQADLQVAKSQLDELSKRERTAITCPVCMEPNFLPRMLNCGHVFCQACLSSHYHAQRSANCPLCRAAIPLYQDFPLCYQLRAQAVAWANANAVTVPPLQKFFCFPPPRPPSPPRPPRPAGEAAYGPMHIYTHRIKYTYSRSCRRRFQKRG
ncbi:uncharacterized protein SCHCODRAFT_02704787 [Schizophyllum commune H4-8]|uniref:uncharacterized protein n=1 Tax=Schizophyllum commune (strain H4-8 / FGSC 9210) TaxID=578458 RepID=UPI00215DE861|nr:uncharacterized protein SCHCODRAFT_02707345 [Schizophyllum commune H4-8]XP_050198035.1 uncharacterized protein SCHCODRAFT_02705821 [Schizophyllum commune H4-8]XP_050198657.1 uncharacterized protein SCHCODRAFT_02704787 [Schizophyllum commune H4-8]KAI5836661.1 hypothetical protein SCHCODRAFT_02707345 [Schizophyllum commune H4-8]KAI5887349.1 hypothetical protein SCHCODRAFT_02705821 [Schizophyllum commune H4-8]KAI5888892.1 hypothetical protein SCHCODRAFT_02704787 [Schizophyllum commune H4-8]